MEEKFGLKVKLIREVLFTSLYQIKQQMNKNNNMASLPVEILLCEDNKKNADLTLRALKKKKIGNQITWVQDGEEALDFLFARNKYKDRNPTEYPKVILLD